MHIREPGPWVRDLRHIKSSQISFIADDKRKTRRSQLTAATETNYMVGLFRGVQYVHWVMHKCIMVKVGGKRNTRKVCKKQVNLFNTVGKICQSIGGKSRNFSGKGKIVKNSSKVRKNFGNRGKSETGGKCIMVSGGWTPLGLLKSRIKRIRENISEP